MNDQHEKWKLRNHRKLIFLQHGKRFVKSALGHFANQLFIAYSNFIPAILITRQENQVFGAIMNFNPR